MDRIIFGIITIFIVALFWGMISNSIDTDVGSSNKYCFASTDSDSLTLQQVKDTVKDYCSFKFNIKIKNDFSLTENQLTKEYFGEFITTDNKKYSLKVVFLKKQFANKSNTLNIYLKRMD